MTAIGSHRSEPAVPDPAPWSVRWTCWPGTAQPLLLAVCPGLPYPELGPPGPAHADAWYCRESLGMTGGDARAPIPALTAVGLVLLADGAELCVAGRPWLQVRGGPHRWGGRSRSKPEAGSDRPDRPDPAKPTAAETTPRGSASETRSTATTPPNTRASTFVLNTYGDVGLMVAAARRCRTSAPRPRPAD